MERKKPVVGQTLYYTDSNDRRDRLEKTTVTKIGRKFFYTNDGMRMFYLSNWSQHVKQYSPSITLYESKEDYDIMIETDKLRSKIRTAFGHYSSDKVDVSIENLRQIYKLVFGEVPEVK